jgi:hypothetical protein
MENFKITSGNDRVERTRARYGCPASNIGNWHETILVA